MAEVLPLSENELRLLESLIHEFFSGEFRWREAPPALLVRPTRFPEKNGIANAEVGDVFVKAGGRNAPLNWMLSAAYGFPGHRMVFPNDLPLPNTKFDYLATLPDCPRKVFQDEIEKVTGFVAHPELRETDVFLLRIKTTNAPGLRPGTIDGHEFLYRNPVYRSTNQPFSDFRSILEGDLQKTVIDETGLTNKYDLSLEWKSRDHDSLKEALLDQLGIELVTARRRIEMLVVGLAKNSDKAALYKEVSPSSIDESLWTNGRLEGLPPVLILRPTRFGSGEGGVGGSTDDLGRWRMLIKMNKLEYLLAAAADFKVNGNYCTWPSRIIVPPNLPEGLFDLMLTVPNARERLQKEIGKQFQLAVRRETREVDALVIKGSEAVTSGVSAENQATFPRTETMRNLPLWIIAQNLEAYLGKPVLVQTRLTNHFTLSVRTIMKDHKPTFDETELKRAFVSQLGLELVSSREPVEMLIVERTQP